MMQDLCCFNIFRKRVKKGRKYKEWKKDEIRDGDFDQMKFLEKQIHRMRKKEEIQVTRKAVTKRNTYGVSNNYNHDGYRLQHTAHQSANNADTSHGRPVSTSNPPPGANNNYQAGVVGNAANAQNANGGGMSSNAGGAPAHGHGSGNTNTGGNHGMGMNIRNRMKY